LASKGAVNILTKAMALDMTPGQVRVNSVSPSWIWSPGTAKAKHFLKVLYNIFYLSFLVTNQICRGSRAEWEPQVPGPFHMMKRMGEMSEVAAAVTFLCSRDAEYINGMTVSSLSIFSYVLGQAEDATQDHFLTSTGKLPLSNIARPNLN
jgi:NAD(P)-dependent dehydrogenase (short-subunit alcohol dehydrogenase family)